MYRWVRIYKTVPLPAHLPAVYSQSESSSASVAAAVLGWRETTS
jgi:hypothetical protein